MKRLKNIRMLLVSTIMLVLTACSGISVPDPAGGAAPIIQVPRTPEETVTAFLSAWGNRDYDTMYAQLSNESKNLNTPSVFRAVYEDADAKIGTSGVEVTIQDVEIQGRSAAVTYDAVISSSLFGTIEDPGRMMRLVQVPTGWGVAWTTMDIFNGYAGGSQLAAEIRREPRGNIYARDGEALVEQDSIVVELYVTQQNIPDYEGCLQVLGTVVKQQPGDLETRFATFTPEFNLMVGEIDPETYALYEGQLTELCSAFTLEHETRRYAGHGSAAHVTGYVAQISLEQMDEYTALNYGPGDLVGNLGVEQQYEAQLAGAASRVLRITEPGGMLIRELAGAEGESPQSVTLTLDYDLQMAAGQALADAYNYAEGNWAGREHSTGGGVVVLDIDSGAVLALASYPMYDPGIFSPDTEMYDAGNYIGGIVTDPRQPLFNRVIQNSYAPGSVFKIVTTAAAADTGIFPPDELFYCGREWTEGAAFGDSLPVRLDWRHSEPPEGNFDTGDVTMSEALAASCNPFFYQMGGELFRRGPGTLRGYANDMGLGNRTGFDLTFPQEVAGTIEVPQGADVAISQAIGQQNTQVTILQMARLVAGVANGGSLYQPYVVQSVGAEGETPTYEAELQIAQDMGLSEEALQVVRDGMCMVTDADVLARTPHIDEQGNSVNAPLGTAWFVFDQPQPDGVGVASYTVCGKTGTAQTTEEPYGWFVAFAPADDPQIAVAAMIEFSREGSETAAPIVRRILDSYFNVPPEEVAPYPFWWFNNEYFPLTIPEGSTGV